MILNNLKCFVKWLLFLILFTRLSLFSHQIEPLDESFKNLNELKDFSLDISNILISSTRNQDVLEIAKHWPKAIIYVNKENWELFKWTYKNRITSIDALILKENEINEIWLKNILNVVDGIQIIYIDFQNETEEIIHQYTTVLKKYHFTPVYKENNIVIFITEPPSDPEKSHDIQLIGNKSFIPSKGIFFEKSQFSMKDFSLNIKPVVYDEEIQGIWEQMDNIYEPSYEDYRLIEEYLKYGKRPYLEDIYNLSYIIKIVQKGYPTEKIKNKLIFRVTFNTRLLATMKMVSEKDRKPELQIIPVNGGGPRCIVLYGTYNENYKSHTLYDLKTLKKESYVDSLDEIIDNLEKIGWKGDVLKRAGGYPLIEQGSIRFAHIPYSFKVLSILEAYSLGYKNILWMDLSLRPLNNLEKIFQEIEQKGSYFLETGAYLDYDYELGLIPDSSMFSSDLTISKLQKIPHTIATTFGVSFNHDRAVAFMEEWYRLTSLLYPALTLYPEEFLISVAKHRAGCAFSAHLNHHFICKSAVSEQPFYSEKPFYFNKG